MEDNIVCLVIKNILSTEFNSKCFVKKKQNHLAVVIEFPCGLIITHDSYITEETKSSYEKIGKQCDVIIYNLNIKLTDIIKKRYVFNENEKWGNFNI